MGLTGISRRTFWGCKRLTEIHIGSKVEKIGDEVFNGCMMLRVYNHAEFPQDCGTDVFSIVKSNCKLYVLEESQDFYRAHKDWYEFNILPMTAEMLDITPVEAATPSAKTYIDLTGKKVITPQRGQVYLQDGKKAMIR